MSTPTSPSRAMSQSPLASSRRLSCTKPTTDSIATWSCYLKYEGIGGRLNGSGVIVEFDVPHTELQALLPSLQNLSTPLETRYALLTCHHTIPDLQSTAPGGWWMFVGSGKKTVYKLDSLVCGVVSCCGENGVISFGPNRSNAHVPVLMPHQNECCTLNLDFTMVFLNQSFEKQVMKKGMPSPPQVHVPSSCILRDPQALFCPIESDAASGTEARMELYHREESEVVIHSVTTDQCLATSTVGDDSRQQLEKEVAQYKQYQSIHYTVPGDIVEGYSGSALVYYDPVTEESRLVGIHVGTATEEEKGGAHTTACDQYIGVSIHGIMQLLSGHPAAFFAVMEHHSARRMWTYRWAHLLIHQLETCRGQLRLEYLVEIFQRLLDKSETASLIQTDFRDLPENILAALRVLISVFKYFEHNNVAEAIKEAHGGDEKAIKEFEDNVADLTRSFPDLIKVGTDEEVAKACSECYYVMLNFKYKGIVQSVLHNGDSLDCLGQLCKRYKCPEILRSFIDILTEKVQACEAQLQQQKEEYEALQQQKEACEAQLQQQMDEHETMEELEGGVQSQPTAEQQLRTKNARLTLDVQNLKVENQRLQRSVEGLRKEKSDAAAACEQHSRELTALRGDVKRLVGEKRALQAEVQQLKQEKERIETEFQERRQKTQEQLITAEDEIENWKSRAAEYERRTNRLSEELEQSKACIRSWEKR